MSCVSHTIAATVALAIIYVNLGIHRCLRRNQANGYGPQTRAEWIVFHLVMRIIVHTATASSLPKGGARQRWHSFLERRFRSLVHFFSLPERRWVYTDNSRTFSWEVQNRVIYIVLDQPGREEPGWLLVMLHGGTTEHVDPSRLDANWLYVLKGRGARGAG